MLPKRLKISHFYEPTPLQREVHSAPHRFRILVAGRRFGKTTLSANEMLWSAWEKPGSLNFWVAPVYTQARIGFNLMLKYLPPDQVKKILTGEMSIELLNDSLIFCKSSDRPEHLRGYGLDFIVGDEFDSWKREAWTEVLRPTLTDTLGRALLIGTPTSRGLLLDFYKKGQSSENEDTWSLHCKSSDNPLILKSELQAAKDSLPEDVFSREYLAEFTSSQKSVFRNFRHCIDGSLEDFKKDESYVMGVDVGKHVDYTVICVLRKRDWHLVSFTRFRRVTYDKLKKKIISICKDYGKADIYLDSTGVGDVILDLLKLENMPVKRVVFTAKSKQKLVEGLQYNLEKGHITFPDIAQIVEELEAYEYGISRTGHLTYQAASGFHDDCVMALALAVQGLSNKENTCAGKIL